MKKNLWMLGMMFVTLFSLTSCEYELEQAVGYDVSGHWYGDLDMWIDGRKCTSSEIEFMPQGWGYRKGRGVQIDHLYSYHVSNYFNYEIVGSSIYLYFEDSSLDCVIRDYRISESYFTGYMDGVYESTRFNLKNYEHYYSEYGSGFYGYYYAREDMGWDMTDSIASDSIASDSITSDSLNIESTISETPRLTRGVNMKK